MRGCPTRKGADSVKPEARIVTQPFEFDVGYVVAPYQAPCVSSAATKELRGVGALTAGQCKDHEEAT